MSKRYLLYFFLALLGAFASKATDAPSAILARSDVFRNPLASFAIDVELTSFDGAKSDVSKFRVYGKGNDRSVVEFTAPATEKGKYLLMLRDAMWIYMPATSRPIRISPLQRLMGQASNGDVARTSFTIDYDAKSVNTDTVDGRAAWVLELEAKDPSLSYKRVRLWIDHDSYEPIRAEFYVVSGKLLKRSHYRKFGTMAGRRVITEIEIEDVVRPGRRTIMRYANLTARENAEKMFTKDAFGRW